MLRVLFVFKKHYLVVDLSKAESYSIGFKGLELLILAFRLGRPNFWHTPQGVFSITLSSIHNRVCGSIGLKNRRSVWITCMGIG